MCFSLLLNKGKQAFGFYLSTKKYTYANLYDVVFLKMKHMDIGHTIYFITTHDGYGKDLIIYIYQLMRTYTTHSIQVLCNMYGASTRSSDTGTCKYYPTHKVT